ncbi:chaplin [Streptomyces sp. NPDC058657]|uniref:chaplin n=1 Tax=unclassified Streptomyces TaxID=2593676 RepID=UPI00364ED3B9
MSKLHKAVAVTMIAGGMIAAGAGAAAAHSGADAHGVATNSPGVGSGNLVQVPVHVPVNASGNSVNVIGLLNPAFGNQAPNV